MPRLSQKKRATPASLASKKVPPMAIEGTPIAGWMRLARAAHRADGDLPRGVRLGLGQADDQHAVF